MRFCTMGSARSLLLKEAVPLLAPRYCNFSFAGPAHVCSVNQLSQKTDKTHYFAGLGFCWVTELTGSSRARMSPRLLQNTGEDSVAGGDDGGKRQGLPSFFPHWLLR